MRAKISTAVFLMIFSVAWCHADTIWIDTRISQKLEDLPASERMACISVESGLMDAIFDSGHLFFNSYIYPDSQGQQPTLVRSRRTAADAGAAQLIQLNMQEDRVLWSLHATEEGTLLGRGEVTYQDTSASMSERERWMQVGRMISSLILPLI